MDKGGKRQEGVHRPHAGCELKTDSEDAEVTCCADSSNWKCSISNNSKTRATESQ